MLNNWIDIHTCLVCFCGHVLKHQNFNITICFIFIFFCQPLNLFPHLM